MPVKKGLGIIHDCTNSASRRIFPASNRNPRFYKIPVKFNGKLELLLYNIHAFQLTGAPTQTPTVRRLTHQLAHGARVMDPEAWERVVSKYSPRSNYEKMAAGSRIDTSIRLSKTKTTVRTNALISY